MSEWRAAFLLAIQSRGNCLEKRALDVVILDLARVGGITPWRKMAALCQAFNVPVCGHVVPEVHVHLLASVSAGHMVEYMPRSMEILQNMLCSKISSNMDFRFEFSVSFYIG